MDKQFSLNEILADAWAIAKKNIWIIMGFTAIQFVVIFLISILAKFLGPKGDIMSFLLNFSMMLVGAFFTVAIYQVFFRLIDEDGDPEFPDFVPSVIKASNFILLMFIIYSFVGLMILSIVFIYVYNSPNLAHIDPAMLFNWTNILLLTAVLILVTYVSIRMCFAVCFIVDQDSGAIKAIRQSWAITEGHFWFLLLIHLVILGINILGTMALFVGLLFTIPFSSLILIVTYRQMVNSYPDDEEILLENPDITNH